jgi:uncharacterized Fe-S cluster-containing radical SAM superfamily protein
VIDTDLQSARLRSASVDVESRRLLVSRFTGSGQESDLTDPPNCNGLGRVRHFTTATNADWPANTLPIVPASAALGLEPASSMNAQVFQNAVCNWRCWYCYVPFDLLKGDPERSEWVSAEELVEGFLAMPERPAIIDLSGGQPDLVPEWTAWMVEALVAAGAEDSTYLWVDDNLSNDYFWRYLTDEQIAAIAAYPGIGRVGCFKGFDNESFSFNTGADPARFDMQFDLFSRHAASGIDTYAYATFTTPTAEDPAESMARFIDRLQTIDEFVPLRLIPLEIAEWGPVHGRMGDRHRAALQHQQTAVAAWAAEVESRFTAAQLSLPVNRVGR